MKHWQESGKRQSGLFLKKNLEQAQKNENIFADGDILFSKAPKQTNMTKSILAKSKQNK
ncbi:MAG: hypothetical protein ACKOCO_18125 [Bacteroidota bacterium]